MAKIVQLYPDYELFDSVHGLYLAEPLQSCSSVVYADYLSSLDGRIAVKQEGRFQLPHFLTSRNDFRLFMELQAHSDCVITNSAYLQSRANDELGDMLHFDPNKQGDLLQWRTQNGLASERLTVVCSTSLKFPEPVDLEKSHVLIAAAESSDSARVEEWRNKGYRVEIVGTEQVEANRLIALLKQIGCRRIFVAGGPKLLTSMVKHQCLDRLYLTIAHQMVGSTQFKTMMDGDIETPCPMHQLRLISDISDSEHEQWYACFGFGQGG